MMPETQVLAKNLYRKAATDTRVFLTMSRELANVAEKPLQAMQKDFRRVLTVKERLLFLHLSFPRIDYSKFVKIFPLKPTSRFCAQDSRLHETNAETNVFFVRPRFVQRYDMTDELTLSP